MIWQLDISVIKNNVKVVLVLFECKNILLSRKSQEGKLKGLVCVSATICAAKLSIRDKSDNEHFIASSFKKI